MPIVDIRKDPETLTMTVTAHFAAPVARVWAAYADPRWMPHTCWTNSTEPESNAPWFSPRRT